MSISFEFYINTEKCTENEAKVLNDYWLFEKKKPLIKNKEILEKHNINQVELREIVCAFSYASRSDYVCKECGKIEYFSSRTYLIAPYQTEICKYKKLCPLCEIAKEEAERAQEREKNRIVPRSMYFHWLPIVTEQELFEKHGIQMDYRDLIVCFRKFYITKPRIKCITDGWEKKFLSHCDRHAKWHKGEE